MAMLSFHMKKIPLQQTARGCPVASALAQWNTIIKNTSLAMIVWIHRWVSGIQARIQVLAPSARAQLHNCVQKSWLLTLALVRPVDKLTQKDRPHYMQTF